MDDQVLKLMRRRIVEDLLDVAGMCEESGRKYLLSCKGWDDIKSISHRGCVLLLPHGGDPSLAIEADAGQNGRRLFEVEVPAVRLGRKLPVHNLEKLLGDELVAYLRRESSTFREGSLFVLGRKRTLQLQLKLWKWQGYMARESEQY